MMTVDWKAGKYTPNPGKRKLDEDGVRAIRRMAADGMPATAIREMFPTMGAEAIRRVIRRETWAHVDPPRHATLGVGENPIPATGDIQAMLRKAEADRLAEEGDAGMARLQAEATKRVDPNALLDAWTTGGKEAAIRLIEGSDPTGKARGNASASGDDGERKNS